MNDPYKVLGVSPSSSDAEIKKAYKELVKKYHPDQYQDNPLSEFADEKMSEINAAYDEIMTSRRNGTAGYSSYDDSSYGSVNYMEVRTLIQRRDITRADNLLENVPSNERNAEWFFLKGSVCYARGWLNDAANNFNTAANMDPSNREYQAARNQMNQAQNGYMRGNPQMYQNNGMNDMSNMCSTLCCADCCCEMMGGDLIPCC